MMQSESEPSVRKRDRLRRWLNGWMRSPEVKVKWTQEELDQMIHAWKPPFVEALKPFICDDVISIVLDYIPKIIRDEQGRIYTLAIEDGCLEMGYGPVIRWHKNGAVKSKGYWVNGYRQGPFTSYNEDGSTDERGQFLDHRRVGHWKTFYPSGKELSSVMYVNGQEHGTRVIKHVNGNIMSEIEMKYGRKDGKYVRKSESGIILESGQYKMNLQHGKWRFFNGDGCPIHEQTYEDGKLVLTRSLRNHSEFL